jgi:phenylacetate-CoA ligase
MGRFSGYSTILESTALPMVGWVTSSKFYDLYRGFLKNGRETVLAPSTGDTLQRLRDLVAHAQAQVPHYRKVYAESGLSVDAIGSLEDFSLFPKLTKDDIVAGFPDRITSGKRDYLPWRYVSTSGTIQRLTAVQDFRKRDLGRASRLLALTEATGYRPGMRYMEIPPDICRDVCGQAGNAEPRLGPYFVDSIRNRTVLRPDVLSNLRGLVERQVLYRVLRLPSYWGANMIQGPQVTRRCLSEISEYKPYVLKALPVYLYLMAIDILDHGLTPPGVPFLMPMGSSLTSRMRSVVQEAFQAEVREDYGSAELGSMAAECIHHTGLHPLRRLFHVEIEREGRPAAAGEIGSILITDLSNYAMPFIRYEIGDLGVMHAGVCPCGIDAPRLELVGRQQDSITTENGGIVPSDSIVDAVLAEPGVLLFQLEVRDRQVFVKVVPRKGASPALTGVFEALEKLLGREFRFDGQLVTDLVPEPGGKFRFVKNLSRKGGLRQYASHV